MKYTVLVPIFFAAIVICFTFQNKKTEDIYPKPTHLLEQQNENDNKQRRAEWIESIHTAEPDIDWRKIEHKNRIKRSLEQKDILKNGAIECNDVLNYADGNLFGKWIEKGSNDQAGSVFDTEYYAPTDEIFLISAGGSIFKGPRIGNEWEIVNQNFRFGTGYLAVLSKDNNKRIIAPLNRSPHYSDDEGVTWNPTMGFENLGNGSVKDFTVLKETDDKIFFLGQSSGVHKVSLMRSENKGSSVEKAFEFDSPALSRIELVNPHNSNDLYIIEAAGSNTTVMQWNDLTNSMDTITTNPDSPIFSTNSSQNLVAVEKDDVTIFFRYDVNNVLYKSTDFAASWIELGPLPANPWNVGIFVSPSNPDLLLMGEVNCYKSLNGGKDWELQNEWWEYYDNVIGKLHADIMHFNEFVDNDGNNCLLISNHGGLNISTDDMETVFNLSLESLNVSQYYSVRTSDAYPNTVFAGSQDQGFQRGYTENPDAIINFEQIISGDYGHIVFTNEQRNMWTNYPGGWVSMYKQANVGGIDLNYTIESEDELVWMPYMIASPNPSEDIIYVAGGSVDGGPGSYIIKLIDNFSEIEAVNLPFNFMQASGGSLVSAIGISKLNQNKFFAVTENGAAFYSNDKGLSWEKSTMNTISGSYLYGQDIYTSEIDENTLWVAGSGYSTPGVLMSTDGGVTFNSMTNGLPPTLVYDIVANEEETMLFAATENGPYVYIVEEDMWHDLTGTCAPANVYWSVEYIKNIKTVRFGTYGRGIWDFSIQTKPSSNEDLVSDKNTITVYPNPASDYVNIRLNKPHGPLSIQLFDFLGHSVLSEKVKKGNMNEVQLEINHLPTGQYVLVIKEGKKYSTQKIIID